MSTPQPRLPDTFRSSPERSGVGKGILIALGILAALPIAVAVALVIMWLSLMIGVTWAGYLGVLA